jgi:hypothetical protein
MYEDCSGKDFSTETHIRTYYPIDQIEQYKRRALEADLIELVVAVVAQLLFFYLWFSLPPRERYGIIAHVVLAICIVFPIINYRYLIVVPFIAFLPDLARAFDFVNNIEISHSLIVLPFVFLAAFVPFVRRPRTALIAGYAACAIWASHLIVDARKYAIIENIGGYLWSDLVLYTLILTVLGFLFVQFLRLTENNVTADRL